MSTLKRRCPSLILTVIAVLYCVFFVNATEENVLVGESKLTAEAVNDFLKLAAENKFVATTNVIPLQPNDGDNNDNNNDNDDNRTVNNKKYAGDDVYKMIYNIESTVKDGEIIESDVYYARYNFIIPGADGKNETYYAFIAHADVELDKNVGLSDEQISYAKEIISKYVFPMDDGNDLCGLMAEKFKQQYPEDNWHAAYTTLEDYYLGADKFVQFEVYNDKILLFSL
ncbi:uncharacterized protein LOC109596941 isoform X2 [Aethina tumida]|uniref:uncharacterized protein LOC109596941 isoform X2 n=1 Tax=Aethina tumida TaxID=116153 RepID=UPI00096B5B6B|nr:uncharacterized protein LOC109596941 isoform X2 [Aethina tumida]